MDYPTVTESAVQKELFAKIFIINSSMLGRKNCDLKRTGGVGRLEISSLPRHVGEISAHLLRASFGVTRREICAVPRDAVARLLAGCI